MPSCGRHGRLICSLAIDSRLGSLSRLHLVAWVVAWVRRYFHLWVTQRTNRKRWSSREIARCKEHFEWGRLRSRCLALGISGLPAAATLIPNIWHAQLKMSRTRSRDGLESGWYTVLPRPGFVSPSAVSTSISWALYSVQAEPIGLYFSNHIANHSFCAYFVWLLSNRIALLAEDHLL